MTDHFRLPPELDLTSGNVAENFRKWRRQLEIYMEASGSSEKPTKTQTAIILNCAGPQTLEVFDQLQFEKEDDKHDPVTVLQKLQEYCNPRNNEVLETFRFWNTNIISPFDAFVTDLRTKAEKCNFQDKDRMIRDKIVFSVNSKVQEKLIREQDLTLRRAITICQAHEQTSIQMQEMNAQVEKLDISTDTGPHKNAFSRRNNQTRRDTSRTKIITNGKFCARNHENMKEKCLAWGKICGNCNGRNHFAIRCKKRKSVKMTREYDDDSASTDSEQWLNAITTNKQRMTALLIVNDIDVRFQVDTGADVNIICQKYVRKEQTTRTKQKLVMWNRTEMRPKGEAILSVKNPKNGEKHSVKFTVVENSFSCLIGLQTSRDLGLITINQENFVAKVTSGTELIADKTDNSDIGDLGTATLTIDPNAKPVALPSRRIPHALREKVKSKIESLLQRGILKKVEEPTPWVNQMVTVAKEGGDVRLCIDPRHLNKALSRQHFCLPTFDDVLPKLQNAKIFSKLDIQEAFWHVKLDEDSSKLTTMITPFGYRVRWTRLPFGLNVSSEIFQNHLSQALENLEGCINVADDIVIAGCGQTKEEAEKDHNRKLQKLRERCQERNIKLNKQKSKIKQTEIIFMGHKINEKGIEPTEEKVRTILETQPPKDIHGVRRFCGMIQYLARFMKNLSDILAPIRELTKKNVDFYWSKECENAFQMIKKEITQAPVLAYYDPKKPLELQVDSSKKAIGMALMQGGKPIEYASRSLTETEQRWAQIEKEMLAVVQGLERFDQYTFGQKVTVINDHKPLSQILNKSLNQAPLRLQKLMMRAGRYNFDFRWIHGSELVIADYLSRDCPPTYTAEDNDDTMMCRQINCAIPDVLLDNVREQTTKDSTLKTLITVIQNGWPESKTHLDATLTPFYDIRDTLSVEDGIIVKGERILIPVSMRQEIKKKLHASHLAYDSMMRRARQTVFWPAMSSEIKQLADNCEACQALKPRNQKETLDQHNDETQEPWEKVG